MGASLDSKVLLCSGCGQNRIPAPPGATATTRFTCCSCSKRAMVVANIECARKARLAIFSKLGPTALKRL